MKKETDYEMDTLEKRIQAVTPLFQDILDGYTLQHYSAYTKKWIDDVGRSLSDMTMYPHKYRRKPVPEEIWVNKNHYIPKPYIYSSENEAVAAASCSEHWVYIAKHFREVEQ